MKKGVLIGIIVVILIIIGFSIFIMQSGNTTDNSYNSMQEKTNQNVETGVSGNVIEVSSSGFSPEVLEVKQGDTITFLNKDSSSHWPASAIHPTHTLYPGSDIKKCGTAEEKMTFDACHSISQGQEYKFTFNEKGSWKYHDHLHPELKGTIVVN